MKKDKEWLLKETENLPRGIGTLRDREPYELFDTIDLTMVLDLIHELEEPQQEKVVVTEDMFWEYMSDHYRFDKEELFEKLKEYNYLKKHSIVAKPAVPQFVAEWIKDFKNRGLALGETLDTHYEDDHEMDVWLYSNKDRNDEVFARAWLDGYEVEKEPQWVVSFLDEDGDKFYFSEFYEEDGNVLTPNGHDKTTVDVIRFKSKSKADALALLINGEVEEDE